MKILKYTLITGFTALLQPMVFAAEAVQHTPVALDYQSQLGRVLGVLLLLLAGIFIVAWLMKKIGVTGHIATGELCVKACLPLSNKDKLYVIEVGDEQLLIGVNAGSITPLKTLEKPLPSSKPFSASTGDFSKKLQDILSQKMAGIEK